MSMEKLKKHLKQEMGGGESDLSKNGQEQEHEQEQEQGENVLTASAAITAAAESAGVPGCLSFREGVSFTRQVMETISQGRSVKDFKPQHPGPRPRNIYNKGFLQNLRAIIWPPSMPPEWLSKRGTGAKIEKTD